MSLTNIEHTNKLLTSIAYRIVLLIVGIAILCIEVNKFHWAVYFAIIILYSAFGLLFRIAQPEKSLIRLIADYTFIVSILYGKGLDTFINSCFIIIPIVNSVNHASSLKSSTSIWRLYVACLISMLVIANFHIKLSWILTFFALGVISFFTKLREWVTRIDNSALASIGEYHGENIRLGNSYLLLQKVINNWQNNFWLSRILNIPTNLVVFKKTGNKFRIISGARFVKNYVFLDEKEVYDSLESKKILYNIEVLIDESRQQPNVGIELAGQVNIYFFYVEFGKLINSENIFDKYIVSAFTRVLTFVVKVLDNEGDMINERNSLMHKIHDRTSLMDRTINVVHFINNRLTPLANYFEMQEFYQSHLKNPDSQAYLKELKELIEKERRKAKNSLEQITIRSKTLMHRANEMRLESNHIPIKLKQFVRLVRDTWTDHGFIYDEISVKWSEVTLEEVINVDTNSLWLVFEEIATNIGKYSKGNSRVSFWEDGNTPKVSFSNKIGFTTNTVNNKRNKLLIEQFNNNDLNEIMKRTNRGLYEIKDFCNTYGIHSLVELNANNFTLTLSFHKP